MDRTMTKRVQFTDENVSLCQCGVCPVQTDSTWVRDELAQLESADSQIQPDTTPLVYCAQGTAHCGDLQFEHQCICPSCEVWTTNDLQNYHYCRDGSAEQIG